jgi:hypothetical protein
MFLPKLQAFAMRLPHTSLQPKKPIKSREEATVIDYDVLIATQATGNNLHSQAQHQQPMDRRRSSGDQ